MLGSDFYYFGGAFVLAVVAHTFDDDMDFIAHFEFVSGRHNTRMERTATAVRVHIFRVIVGILFLAVAHADVRHRGGAFYFSVIIAIIFGSPIIRIGTPDFARWLRSFSTDSLLACL